MGNTGLVMFAIGSTPTPSIQEDAKYWGNVGDALIAPCQKSMAEGRPGEIVGRGVFDIGTLLSGAGAAGYVRLYPANRAAIGPAASSRSVPRLYRTVPAAHQ